MALDSLSVCLFSSLNLLLLHWTIWTENRILITQRAKKAKQSKNYVKYRGREKMSEQQRIVATNRYDGDDDKDIDD